MAKEVKKPKEELAPAYFALYSSLWCILLGFFVMLLSLGSTQSGIGDEGLGEVRDAFGGSGGLGLLPFSKNAIRGWRDRSTSTLRIRVSDSRSVAAVDEYVRGMLWKKGLTDISLIKVIKTQTTTKVILQVPVKFIKIEKLDSESALLLELLGEVFLNLKQYDIQVLSYYKDDSNPEVRARYATVRSAVIARFMTQIASLSPERIKAVGYSDTKILEMSGINPVDGQVWISIQ